MLKYKSKYKRFGELPICGIQSLTFQRPFVREKRFSLYGEGLLLKTLDLVLCISAVYYTKLLIFHVSPVCLEKTRNKFLVWKRLYPTPSTLLHYSRVSLWNWLPMFYLLQLRFFHPNTCFTRFLLFVFIFIKTSTYRMF